jgi:hypothetical protein
MKHLETPIALALTASLIGGAAPDVMAPKHEAAAHSQELVPTSAEAPDPTLVGTVVSPDGRTQINTHRVSLPVERPYARHFSASPAAHEAPDMNSLQPLNSMLFDLKAKGEKVEAVRVKGFASEEKEMPENTGAASAGIGVKNQEDIGLANTRRDAAIPAVEQAVAATTGEAIKVIPEEGEEVTRPELVPKIEALAAKYKTTPLNLSRKFNLSQGVPADVAEALAPWKGDRRDDITITSTETKPINSTTGQKDGNGPTPPVGVPGIAENKTKGSNDNQGDRTPTVAPPVVRTIPSVGEPKQLVDSKDAILTDMPSYPVDDTFARRGGFQQQGRVSAKAQGGFRAQNQMQPREHNMGKNSNLARNGNPRGRVSRSHGGNRRG